MDPLRRFPDKSSSCIGLCVVCNESGIWPLMPQPARDMRESDDMLVSQGGMEERFKGLKERSRV